MNLPISLNLLGAVALTALTLNVGCGGASAEETADTMPRVDVVEVDVETITTTREWTGLLRPLRSVSVNAPEAGTIAELLVAEGDVVKHGDRLVRIDGPELSSRQEVLVQRRSSLREELDRWERLAAADAAGPGEVESVRLRLLEVEEALAELDARIRAVNLRAPVDGRVTTLMVPADATVGVGDPLMRIEDVNTQGLRLRIPAVEAHYFDSTDQLTLTDRQGTHLPIDRIIVTEDALAPGFLAVELSVVSEGLMGPVLARLQHEVEREVLIVPWTAVASEGNHHWVAVVKGAPSTIVRRHVDLGVGQDRGVEVSAGLEPGEHVVRFEPRSLPEGREVTIHQSP